MNVDLTINIILYFVFFCILYHKQKLTLASGMAFFYFVVALLGLVVFNNGLYENVFFITQRNAIKIVPYILCFISVAILITPLSKVRYENIQFSQIPYNKVINICLIFWVVDMIAFFVLKIAQATVALSLGLDEMYEITNVDGDLADVMYGGNTLLLAFNNFNINLLNSLSPFLMAYAFYGIIKQKIPSGLAYTIIVLNLMVMVANGVSMGSRGNLFFAFCSFSFYLILFYRHLQQKSRNTFKWIGGILICVIGFYAALTTLQRIDNSDSETPIGSVVRYFGEPFPNLTNNFYEKVSKHPEGKRLFPYAVGGNNVTERSLQDTYNYWEDYTKVPVRTFKTIFGDLYIEYGSFWALVIILFIALGFGLFVSGAKIPFWKMAFIYWYFDLVLQGIFGFNKGDTIGLFYFIVIFLVSMVIKVVCSKLGNDEDAEKSETAVESSDLKAVNQ